MCARSPVWRRQKSSFPCCKNTSQLEICRPDDKIKTINNFKNPKGGVVKRKPCKRCFDSDLSQFMIYIPPILPGSGHVQLGNLLFYLCRLRRPSKCLGTTRLLIKSRLWLAFDGYILCLGFPGIMPGKTRNFTWVSRGK